jgi:hypothetical protein
MLKMVSLSIIATIDGNWFKMDEVILKNSKVPYYIY